MTQRGLGGLPRPEPGEMTVADVASRMECTPVWVRKLAQDNALPSRVVEHGARRHYFFQRAAVDSYLASHPPAQRRRAARTPGGQLPDEARYLREQVGRLQADRDRLQEELTSLRVDWSAGEARLDELRQICEKQALTIGRLADTVKELGQLAAPLGH